MDNAEFCESKSATGGYAPRQNDSQISPYAEPATAFSTAAPDDFEEITGDDQLPF